MNTASASASRPARAFTLVEVLLSIVLLGSLFVALNIFLFSMAELWGGNRDQRLFEEHARAVTRHVAGMLRDAQYRSGGEGLTPAEIRLPAGGRQVLLTFTAPQGDRLIPWPDKPLPDVECALGVVEREGLMLYWQSRLDLRYREDPPGATVLSPFGVSVAYDYYEEKFKRWRTTDQIERDPDGDLDTYLLPTRVRLRFEHAGQSLETTVMLPARQEGATWY